MTGKIRIGALISGGGTNLQAIIDSCEAGKIDGQLAFVGSDNPGAKGLDRAAKHHIPFFAVDYAAIIRKYKNTPPEVSFPEDADWDDIVSKQHLFHRAGDSEKVKMLLIPRVAAEAALLDKMAPYNADLVVLAGFMRNLTPYFIDKVNAGSPVPKIMNIHPALLPAFPGVDGYGDTYRYGCKIGGCTVHFIDYGEDSGPIIGQKAFPIAENDTLESVKEKGLALEWELYPECIQLFARGRLKTINRSFDLGNGKTVERTRVETLAEDA
jgi:phosphoribosylglycinamide formyltransferase 1